MDKDNKVIGDSMSVTINFKWLIQLIVVICVGAYGVYKFETRINQLETSLEDAVETLMVLEQERKVDQQKEMSELEQKIGWYEKELNLNPFSWGKKNNTGN